MGTTEAPQPIHSLAQSRGKLVDVIRQGSLGPFKSTVRLPRQMLITLGKGDEANEGLFLVS